MGVRARGIVERWVREVVCVECGRLFCGRCVRGMLDVCVLVMIEGVDVGVWKGKAVVGVVWTWLSEERRELCGCVGLWFAGCVACFGFGCDVCCCGEAVCLGTASVLRGVVRSGLDCSTCHR